VVRDSDGLLRFIGRLDETIKTMGTRVSPTEIEELAYQSGVVVQAVALGIADETAGQRIRLVVSAADGMAAAVAEQALRSHLKREAAAYMQPASIIWMDALPISANGKLDRAAIREKYGA